MSSNRELVSTDDENQLSYVRPRGYIQPRGGQSIQGSLPAGKPVSLGFLAKLRHGKEINDHILALLRGEHLLIEAEAAKENVAISIVNGARLRLQVAHQGGLFIREYGPDSAAFEIVPLIAQTAYDKVDAAFEDIEKIFLDNTKANLRRR